MSPKEIIYTTVKAPTVFKDLAPTPLSDETMQERREHFRAAMIKEKIELAILYADKEHGSNFEYFTGFIPRFEEGLLLIDQDLQASLILGNENLKMASHARLKADLIHYPQFSLPNQPMDQEKSLAAIFQELGVARKKKIALIGWKLFTTAQEDPSQLFDLPYFIVEALKSTLAPTCELINGAHLLIGSNGLRTINNANEIAHYEYGANLSSRAIL